MRILALLALIVLFGALLAPVFIALRNKITTTLAKKKENTDNE